MDCSNGCEKYDIDCIIYCLECAVSHLMGLSQYGVMDGHHYALTEVFSNVSKSYIILPGSLNCSLGRRPYSSGDGSRPVLPIYCL